jgi:DsbC/DsbD-like thiol-disulfide interchange protein
MTKFRALIAALCLAAPPVMSGPSVAQDVPDDLIVAELLPGWQTEDGTRMTALHLRLASGWKTYWRVPGEAGIPPSFDWRGSQNLAGVDYHWPRPELFEVNGMRTIGYHDDLVLPIEMRPVSAGKPVVAAARIDLGVCKDICVPVSLDLSLSFDPGEAGTPDPAISEALASSPESADRGGVARATCQAEPIRDGMRLSARVTMPPLGGDEIAVLELSDRPVWVSDSQSHREGGDLVAVSDFVPDNAQPFAVNRSTVRITVFGGTDRVVEIQGCAG